METVAYDKAELRGIIRAFKAMDDAAVDRARAVSGELATKLADGIKATSTAYGPAAQRVAYGVRVSKTSKIGEFSYGYVGQRYSGGGTTKELWPGLEFGSSRLQQFSPWSGREGRGNRGKFIYPTLRAHQPYIVAQWQEAFSTILKEWT